MFKHLTRQQNIDFMDRLHKRVASASVLLTTADDRLLILKAYYKRHWSLPGGLIDDNESIIEAAVREVFEETGIKLSHTDLEFYAILDRYSDITRSYSFIFAAEITDKQVASIKLQTSEIDDYRTVSRDQIMTDSSEYSKIIVAWANRQSGYIEDKFKGASSDE